MRTEVRAAVDFLSNLAQRRGRVGQIRARRFAARLEELLCEKYARHWYPENPGRGHAFRCIRINRDGPLDESVLRACEESDVSPTELGLPPEITLWIDPEEVCVRLTEDQHFFKLRFGNGATAGEWHEGARTAESTSGSARHSASFSDCEAVLEGDEGELYARASRRPRIRGYWQLGSGRLTQVHRHQSVSRPWRIVCSTDSVPMLGYYIYPYPKQGPKFIIL